MLSCYPIISYYTIRCHRDEHDRMMHGFTSTCKRLKLRVLFLSVPRCTLLSHRAFNYWEGRAYVFPPNQSFFMKATFGRPYSMVPYLRTIVT